jgi:CheY-like chemotaxis protein
MLAHDVSSGPEALEWLRRGEPCDGAILDMHMPDMDGIELGHAIRQLGGRRLPLMMLTSIGEQHLPPAGEAIGFSCVLIKPARTNALREALSRMLAGQENTRTSATVSVELPHDLGTRHPLRILVAEDNVTNQKLAQHLLGRLGYRSDAVADGREAVAALERVPYDVVLMDIQMPEMDGLTAARKIRELVPAGRMPRIIAMTANAMQGDREACLAAGLDDYISKPIRVQEVVQALLRSPSRVPESALVPGAG